MNSTTGPLPNTGKLTSGINSIPISNTSTLTTGINNTSAPLLNTGTLHTINTTPGSSASAVTTSHSYTPTISVNGKITILLNASTHGGGMNPAGSALPYRTPSGPLSNYSSTAATTSRATAATQLTTLRPISSTSIFHRKFTLKFSLSETFTADLLNSSSERYRILVETITREVDKMYSEKFPKSFFRSIVTGFSNGSIVTEVDLLFNEGQEPLSVSAVLKVLYATLTNNSNSPFPLRIILMSIQVFEEISISVNLSLVLPSASVLDPNSLLHRNISAALDNWLKLVLSRLLGNTSKALSIKFSDAHGWADASLHYQLKTQMPMSNNIIAAAILTSQSPFLYLKHLLSVSGFQAQFDSFPLLMRITSLNFSEDLSKRGSEHFGIYSTYIRTSVRKLYKNTEGFNDVYVTNMTAGSLVAHLIAVFERNTSTLLSVTEVLKLGLAQLEMDGLTVDPATLGIVPPSSIPPTPWRFPGYAVAILVMCGIVLILLPLALFVGIKTGMWRRIRTMVFLSSWGYDVAGTHCRI
ncbi:uncharacterized protein LOC114910483 [Scleropages formosus]|uniref:uncharacterized protein LOC114910483 n=1 Tax=Scleropages formosus TaxID=113540 RepID=UPI0010FAC0B8|nr:uncharacterized protein LOC114910483 [Scleropages formosus]